MPITPVVTLLGGSGVSWRFDLNDAVTSDVGTYAISLVCTLDDWDAPMIPPVAPEIATFNIYINEQTMAFDLGN